MPPARDKVSVAYSRRYPPPANMLPTLGGILAVGVVLSLLIQSYAHVILVVSICAYGGVFCHWMRAKILSADTGNDDMRAIADPIRQGSEGFLRVQYEAISKLSVVVALIIFLSYFLRPAREEAKGVEKLGGKLQ